MTEITTIEELILAEQQLMQDLGTFEDNFKHENGGCLVFKRTGFCKHLQEAENKALGAKAERLLAARLAFAGMSSPSHI